MPIVQSVEPPKPNIGALTMSKLDCCILNRAADMILEGFAKNLRHINTYDGKHQMCMLGAIETANTGIKDWHHDGNSAEEHPKTAPLLELVVEVLPQAYRRSNSSCAIAAWNNEESRTAEEVAAKLREAAALCQTRNTQPTQ
jgi:hypothetical protein